ncbi:adenylate cyclase [Ephemerocybe angulata]|uniref:Adenylate cyclase n=1 Tax=Ephemerocybe angulata TaxID=980116 RepID=A0A8H6HFL4_9AGAR|nr:adenylate cyclase [Tulosesus angulatus]
MARRGSAMTVVSLRLTDDAVDQNGVARLAPIDYMPASDDAAIAPWIAVPPTPLPKSPGRTFSFGPKSSVASLVSNRNGSGSHYGRSSRPSESQSTLSIPDPNRRSIDEYDSLRAHFTSGSSAQSFELRKSKSSLTLNGVFGKLRSRASKPNIHADAAGQTTFEPSHPSLKNPVPPLPATFMGVTSDNYSSSGSRISLPFKSGKGKKKKDSHPPLPPNPYDAGPSNHQRHPNLDLDLDLNKMDGIVDFKRTGYLSSPGSGTGSDFGNSLPQPMLSSADFNDPFSSSSSAPQNRKNSHYRVSPTTVILPNNFTNGHRPMSSSGGSMSNGGATDASKWVAPQSWVVVKKEGEDHVEPTGDSESDDESARSSLVQPKMSTASFGTIGGEWSFVSPPDNTSSLRSVQTRERDRDRRSIGKPTMYNIRIYRSNRSAHRVTLEQSTTVAELNKMLFKVIYQNSDRGEQHRLYLNEGGRERILGPTERPANIVRKRLLLNGFEPEDGIENLGYVEQPFLFKFAFKSQLLGPPEEDLHFDTFDFIDLTGQSLRTIPVILHQNADSIVSLKLSQNPMVEIPLDFIQSCSSLRELRLSNMAMQKVPQSVRHATSLHRLDLSSNRIGDLEDAFLDQITGLMSLKLQNNKLNSLPWHFGRLRCINSLNISNNKFSQFPLVVTQMPNLLDLDISFNTITELPEEIGQLKTLNRLSILGNQITRFPDECSQLTALRVLDCRRNMITDLTIVLMLPNIEAIDADHNALSALDLSIGPKLTRVDVSNNDITKLSLTPGPVGRSPYSLTFLDLSYAKLSSLDDIALGTLVSLRTLKLDHNSFLRIPDTLGELRLLETLSVSDNNLTGLPESIGRLQKLDVLDAHHNALTAVPESLWNCASLTCINFTSNHIKEWPHPPNNELPDEPASAGPADRKGSTASTNRLGDYDVHPLMQFKELRVLNLSFNNISDLPPTFFKNLLQLEELYLSGNRLTTIPTEDLQRMTRLSTLFLNGNKLHTLPQELGKVKDLTILDVGSNQLRYNINNWEFDWNWNFNKKLKYLNLSGNNRLHIKPEPSRNSGHRMSRDLITLGRQTLAGFRGLTNLRVLGLIDVTYTNTNDAYADIPDESDIRRVRTSNSEVGTMSYGIADSLGTSDALHVLDLVHEFPTRPGEPKKAIFAMFGRYRPPKGLHPHTSPNRVSKFLRDEFVNVFTTLLQVDRKQEDLVADAMRRRKESVPDALRKREEKETVPYALRRKQGEGVPDCTPEDSSFELNRKLYLELSAFKRKNSQASSTAASSGQAASAVVVYFVDKTMYAANVGNAMAVKHDPYDRNEIHHIRSAEGWVSGAGLVNDEVATSRSFGNFLLVPVVNAKPHITTWQLGSSDEFRDHCQPGITAVDIVGDTAGQDPMIAAQKLRDFAISYGADGSTMIMVVTLSKPTQEYRPKRVPETYIKDASRFQDGDPASLLDILALVFTDVRNSTHLWEVNPGMPTAMRLHNQLMRWYAFMVAFPTALSAVWWCLTVQKKLLEESWPLEILECEDGKNVLDDNGLIIARGLSVRMGIHCGFPSVANGGQIMITADILREINVRCLDSTEESESEYSKIQPQTAVDGIKEIGVVVEHVGEVKLKGIELPELLSVIYPKGLEGRHKLKEGPSNETGSASRVQLSVPQTKELGMLCLRLEALSGGRLFRSQPERKGSIASAVGVGDEAGQEGEECPAVFTADPELLLPKMCEASSDKDLMVVLDSLSGRIENAIESLARKFCPPSVDKDEFMAALMEGKELDARTLEYISSVLRGMP